MTGRRRSRTRRSSSSSTRPARCSHATSRRPGSARRSRRHRRSSTALPERLRVGLVTFAGRRQRRRVPDPRPRAVRRSVAAITRWQAGGGTAIGDALARAVELGRDAFGEEGGTTQDGRPDDASGDVTILFLSDGRQNRGLIPAAAGRALAAEARESPSTPSRSAPTRPDGGAGAGSASAGSTGCPTGRPCGRSRRRPGRVLRRPLGGGALVGLRRSRLAPRSRPAPDRGHALFLVAAAGVTLAAAAGLSRSGRPGLPEPRGPAHAPARSPNGGLRGREDVLVHPEDVVRVVRRLDLREPRRSSARTSPSPAPGPRPIMKLT